MPGQIEASVNVDEGLTRFGTRTGGNGAREVDPGKIEPHFAESWTVSPDGKVYVFRIRLVVKSPFGNELSAEDVVWTFNKSVNQKRTGLFIKNVASRASTRWRRCQPRRYVSRSRIRTGSFLR